MNSAATPRLTTDEIVQTGCKTSAGDLDLFANSFVGMAIMNADGRFAEVNTAFENFTGRSAAELRDRQFSDIVGDDQRDIVRALLLEPPSAPRQQRFHHKDGRDIWALLKLEPLTGSADVLLQAQDITAFKTTRIELEKSQRRLTTLMSNLPGMAYRGRVDRDRTMEFVSDGSVDLTGLTPEHLAAADGTRYGRLINPEDRDSMWQQLNRAVREREPFQLIYRLIAGDGSERWVKEQGQGVYQQDGELVAIEGLITDVTKSQRLARRLAYQAAHDDLTGLVNRREFENRVSKALDHARRFGVPHALCYLDLDQFKIINDTVGHGAGDELLKQIAGLLNNKIRSRDTLARLGGDEFGLLLENCPPDSAVEIASTLVSELHDFRFVWQERIFQVGVSIGLVPITADIDKLEQLLSRADVACYTAKDLGRNRVHVYQSEDADLVRRHSEIERVASLRDALENDRLHLYQQPIRSLSGDDSAGAHCEVLLRLKDQNDKLLPPGAFIPAAERYGLMESIDRWVVTTVLTRFEELFEHDPHSLIAINLSGNSLTNESLFENVKKQLLAAKVEPEQICFEITETAVVSNLAQASRFIAEMKRIGCRFALDDFGSGLSSFAYLKYFPVDFLKIDGSFVRDMVEDKTDHAMVAAINQIGHVMGIRTIAEYAETDAVVDSLRALEVDFVQGFAVGAPMPMPKLTARRPRRSRAS